MIFLIEYDRAQGHKVKMLHFADSQRKEAEDVRLGIELVLNRNSINHEVVLLDAEDENALRRTHRRYFEDLPQILTNETERSST